MTEFFKHFKEKLRQEHVSEAERKNIFSGLKGIVFLDTLGDKANAINEVTSLDTGLPVLEIREVGLDGLKHLIAESIEKAKTKL